MASSQRFNSDHLLKRGRKRKERALKRNVEIFKDSLGIDKTLHLLCDVGFLDLICELDNDSFDTLIAGIQSLFDVEEIFFSTTWCVLEDIEFYHKKYLNIAEVCRREAGVMRANSRHNFFEQKEFEGWEAEKHAENLLRSKEFALSLPMRCQHAESPINGGPCFESVFRNQVICPFVLGSSKPRRCNDTMKSFGIPALLVQKSGLPTVLPSKLKKYHEKKLGDLKGKREREEALVRAIKVGGLELKNANKKMWEEAKLKREEEAKLKREEEAKKKAMKVGGGKGTAKKRKRN